MDTANLANGYCFGSPNATTPATLAISFVKDDSSNGFCKPAFSRAKFCELPPNSQMTNCIRFENCILRICIETTENPDQHLEWGTVTSQIVPALIDAAEYQRDFRFENFKISFIPQGIFIFIFDLKIKI